MMHLFINSLAASSGGGLTYIRSLVPHLAARPDIRATVAIPPGLRKDFQHFDNIGFLEIGSPGARRFWYEQARLSGMIRRSGADILLSAGNFALWNSPIPQILLSRNSIYTSSDFYRDLRSRREYTTWLDTHLRAILAKRSIHWADATVAPSEAFAAELQRWTGVKVRAVHHGFDPEAFTRDPGSLAAAVVEKIRGAEETKGSLKLLFVSHYNYYRNFETLLRALPLLRERLSGRAVRLLLTCRLKAGENPGSYRPESAADLARELGISDIVLELGAIAYDQLHHLYRRADVYVTPAYTETFAHPLVEAMACGLPVVASDLAVHREICGNAALYFPRFSPKALAEAVDQVVQSGETSQRMAALGLERSRQFSWKKHVAEIVELSEALAHSKVVRAAGWHRSGENVA